MKRQKWLTGILVVMLVTSFLLAVGAFAPIVASASGGGGGGIESEEICSNYDCYNTGEHCEYQGQWGTWYHCCWVPFPAMCDRCPSPCCWDECHWW